MEGHCRRQQQQESSRIQDDDDHNDNHSMNHRLLQSLESEVLKTSLALHRYVYFLVALVPFFSWS